jgi:hypothetical protein
MRFVWSHLGARAWRGASGRLWYRRGSDITFKEDKMFTFYIKAITHAPSIGSLRKTKTAFSRANLPCNEKDYLLWIWKAKKMEFV